jgi:hypothetical protein
MSTAAAIPTAAVTVALPVEHNAVSLPAENNNHHLNEQQQSLEDDDESLPPVIAGQRKPDTDDDSIHVPHRRRGDQCLERVVSEVSGGEWTA